MKAVSWPDMRNVTEGSGEGASGEQLRICALAPAWTWGAVKKLTSAQAAFDTHLESHDPVEWKQIVAERAVAAQEGEGSRRKGGQGSTGPGQEASGSGPGGESF